MNVLVLCDDRWHPARTPREGLAPLADAAVTFDFIEVVPDGQIPRLDAYPVGLLTKSNNGPATLSLRGAWNELP